MNIVDCVQSTQKLQGALIECGVYEGGTAYLIQQHNLQNKPFYLVDSFEGLPAPTIDDGDQPLPLKQGDYKGNIEKAIEKLPYENITIIKGTIPNAFKAIQNAEFCFAHLDLDFHDATLESIKFIEPHLVKDGIILIHDAHLYGIKRAISTYFNIKLTDIEPLPDNYWMWQKP